MVGVGGEKSMDLHLWLVGTLNLQTEVLSLDGCKLGELDVDVLEVEHGNLLVEDLGEDVNTNWLLASDTEFDVFLAEVGVLRLVEEDLGKDLVGERAGHDERGVAGGTAKVNKAALSEEEDVAAVGHEEAVNLGLDALDGLGVGLEPRNIDLNIEMSNVWRASLVRVCKNSSWEQVTYCRRWHRSS
jgi:hypothetical protein